MATQKQNNKPAAAPNSWLPTTLFFIGMVLVFLGERVIASGTARTVTTCLGLLVIVGSAIMRAMRIARAEGDAKVAEKLILKIHAIGVLALLVYFVQSDFFASLGWGKPLEREWPKLQTTLAVLWPALFIASLVPSILIEMAYSAIASAPILELGRLRDAMYSGFGLAGALVFAFSFNYVGTNRDKKIDFSYFRTARPGESTRKIVRTLDAALSVSIFFPPANDVAMEVESYFNDLKAESKNLEVGSYDHAVDVVKAKELGASGNGIVVFSRGGRKEMMTLGLELEGARYQLRNFDKEAQKRILQVAKPQRTVYLTTGHGERAGETAGETDKRATIRDLKEAMVQQGYQVRNLGIAEGLGADVPSDAAVVLVLGPQKPFLPEELASLNRYIDRGGRMFVALDPDAGAAFKDVLDPLGLEYIPATLASEQIYARKTYQQSDRLNIATGTYSSHPSVTQLGRLGMRAPMVLPGSGALGERKDKPKDLTIDVTVRSHPSTFDDKNGNFTYDTGAETKKAWELAAAVTRKKKADAAKPEEPKPGDKPGDKDKKDDKKEKAKDDARVIVLADSDALADGVITNPGNAYFFIDGMKWLLGDEGIAGETSSEVDLPITHTNKQNQLWFYSTIFLAPALTLGLGFIVTKRRRGRGGVISKSKESAA